MLAPLLFAALVQVPAPTQELAPGTTYDPAIPTLEEVVGHDFREDVTPPADVVRYFEALAEAAPDRTHLIRYAESWEGRPLIALVVASPDIAVVETSRGRIGCDERDVAEVERLGPAKLPSGQPLNPVGPIADLRFDVLGDSDASKVAVGVKNGSTPGRRVEGSDREPPTLEHRVSHVLFERSRFGRRHTDHVGEIGFELGVVDRDQARRIDTVSTGRRGLLELVCARTALHHKHQHAIVRVPAKPPPARLGVLTGKRHDSNHRGPTQDRSAQRLV